MEKYLEQNHISEVRLILLSSEEQPINFIVIDLSNLQKKEPSLYNSLHENTYKEFHKWNQCLLNVQTRKHKNSSEGTVKEDCYVRFENMPSIGEFPSYKNEGCFIEIKGNVVRLSMNTTLESKRDYTCSSCKCVQTVKAKYITNFVITPPRQCPKFRNTGCKGFMNTSPKLPGPGYFLEYQEVLIQEISDRAVPKTFVITLENDLIDSCIPGETVQICGVVEKRFSPLIEGQQIKVSIMLRAISVLRPDHKARRLDKDEQRKKVGQKWNEAVDKYGELGARDELIKSLFPSVLKVYYPKLALALVLCGGMEKIDRNGKKIRAQSHILFVGDPGTAKSRLLEECTYFISPSHYTNGVGCSSAGITASCVSTKSGWELEAGALVLCNGGIFCIDEINLLKPCDRSSIHEAMEQQNVSVAKAGMVTKLPTQCSIIAATNPKANTDKIEEDWTTDCIGLDTPLLSRFDLILSIRDECDSNWDNQIADFILYQQQDKETYLWTKDQLKFHFAFVRNLMPTLPPEIYEIISEYIKFCRSDEFRDISRTTMRMNDSLIRLTLAHAKLCFRTRVEIVDAVTAIILMESSMGFGRFFKPLNLIQSDLPLEPSYITIEAILKQLKLEDLLKPFKKEIEPKPSQKLCSEDLFKDFNFENEDSNEADLSQKSLHSLMNGMSNKENKPTKVLPKWESFAMSSDDELNMALSSVSQKVEDEIRAEKRSSESPMFQWRTKKKAVDIQSSEEPPKPASEPIPFESDDDDLLLEEVALKAEQTIISQRTNNNGHSPLMFFDDDDDDLDDLDLPDVVF